MDQMPLLLPEPERRLTARHMSLISLGGIIGTGLFVGVRNNLIHGPLVSIGSYIGASVICIVVLLAVGEMACHMPVKGSICQFQFEYLNLSWAVAINYVYWMSWGLTLAFELSLMTLMIGWWEIKFVIDHPMLITFILWLMFLGLNLMLVDHYGEIESMITLLKLIFVLGWMAISAYLAVPVGTTNWVRSEVTIQLSFLSLLAACFTFQLVESVAICLGEIIDPTRAIPRAVNYVGKRIVVIYLGCLVLLTLLISKDDPQLSSSSEVMSSPFLIALINGGLLASSTLLSGFNAIILVSMVLAANSNLYLGSRCLVGIGARGYAPKVVLREGSNKAPYVAVMATAAFGLLSLLTGVNSVQVVFETLLVVCLTSGLMMWVFLLLCYRQYSRTITGHPIYRPFPRIMRIGVPFATAAIPTIIFLKGITADDWLSMAYCFVTPMTVLVIATTHQVITYRRSPHLNSRMNSWV